MSVAALMPLLRAAGDLQTASGHLLRTLLRACQDDLDHSPHRGRGELLLATLHLRPGAGYRSLVVERWRGGAPPEPEVASSATAWRWLVSTGQPVAIDVELGRVSGPDGKLLGETDERPLTVRDSETLERLSRRGTTHVYVLPLRLPGGEVVGMVSLEARCRPAIGKPFVWPDNSDRLELLVDVATPSLYAAPTPVEAVANDELMPVVGQATAGLLRMLRVFAREPETLLILGPTGSGKSRLARWCHARSARSDGPFESADLMAIPDEMQLAELFGWRRGAFTGAERDHDGFVARAAGGTLFLDEIDKLTRKAQAGLLRLLEERAYRRLGDSGDERPADVRFIVASNADLAREVRDGRFREDLYYRINIFPARLPSLDERRDELFGWAAFLLARRAADHGARTVPRLLEDAAEVLRENDWPGNLRELDNVMRRAYALALAADADGREVGGRHVADALALDQRVPERGEESVLVAVEQAARAFVDEARRRYRDGRSLDLDLADAFKGFVLKHAIVSEGSPEAAFRLFGKAHVVEARNHQKLLRRALARIDELTRRLAER